MKVKADDTNKQGRFAHIVSIKTAFCITIRTYNIPDCLTTILC